MATKVYVLYTGGTIGMVPSDDKNPNSPLRPADQARLTKYISEEIRNQGINWTIEGLKDDGGNTVGPLDSSSVGPKHWVYMAQAIERAYEDNDGFVILHGTDTMAYTASALSFLLPNLGKPVIITGSQLPIYQPRTDAVLNFINALYIAGYRSTNLPRVPEVAICFGDALLRGNRTTKTSTSRWQGFESPNYPPLGQIGEHISIDKSLLLPVPGEEKPFYIHTHMEEKVATISLYPGMAATVLQTMLDLDVKGFILRSFGTGNAPEDDDFAKALETAISKEKIVVNTTQCLEGRVEMGQYAASSGLQAAGVITGLDLTPEAALTKLMWLLGSGERPLEVSTQMQINQRGEQSGTVFDVRYGRVGDQSTPVAIFKKSIRPPGQFDARALKSAILRLDKIGVEGAQLGAEIKIAVFIDLPNADDKTSEKVPQFAGYLSGRYDGPDKTVLLRDVRDVVARVHEAAREIHLALIGKSGQKFWAEGAYLTLFNE
jgi:L-asparaginase